MFFEITHLYFTALFDTIFYQCAFPPQGGTQKGHLAPWEMRLNYDSTTTPRGDLTCSGVGSVLVFFLLAQSQLAFARVEQIA